MATLVQQQKVLERLSNKEYFLNIVAKAADPDASYENRIIEMNQEQLSDGENNRGNLIGRYKELTQQYARAENLGIPKNAGEPYNFEWTGDFFRAFKIKKLKYPEIFEITSSVPYLSDIQSLGTRNRANNKLFGLKPMNLENYINGYVLKRVLSAMKDDLMQRRF